MKPSRRGRLRVLPVAWGHETHPRPTSASHARSPSGATTRTFRCQDATHARTPSTPAAVNTSSTHPSGRSVIACDGCQTRSRISYATTGAKRST